MRSKYDTELRVAGWNLCFEAHHGDVEQRADDEGAQRDSHIVQQIAPTSARGEATQKPHVGHTAC